MPQVTAFAVLLAVLLGMPLILSGMESPARSDVYRAVAWKFGPYPWIDKMVFREKADVDIAFLGSSYIWSAIDAVHVRERLSERLGHRAEVFTLGWPWAGFDALYFIASDLLAHRRVHMLVINDEGFGGNEPHLASSNWFLVRDHVDAMRDLPLPSQVGLYGGAVLGMPRHLLTVLRTDLIEDPMNPQPNYWNAFYRAPHAAQRLGSLRAHRFRDPDRKFERVAGDTRATREDVVIYRHEAESLFRFSGPPTQPYQLQFARKLASMCRDRGTKLVFVHTPKMYAAEQCVILERECWPGVLGGDVQLAGIPEGRLFAGLGPAEVSQFFFDENHMNANGQDLFTSLITPALLSLYDTAAAR